MRVGPGRKETEKPATYPLLQHPTLTPPHHPIHDTPRQVTATDTTVKDLSTLNLEGAVETVLADDVVVGGTYNYNSAVAKPEEIYVKKTLDVKLVSEAEPASLPFGRSAMVHACSPPCHASHISFDGRQGDLALDARYRLPSQVAALTATLKRNADYIKAAFNTENVVGVCPWVSVSQDAAAAGMRASS